MIERVHAMTEDQMTRPYAFAGLYASTVYALGRSERGVELDRKREERKIGESIALDAVVPCTRRAYAAIKRGEVRVATGGPGLHMVDGVLDTERGPGRPRASRGERSITVAVRVPESDHARLVARASADGVTASDVARAAIDAYL